MTRSVTEMIEEKEIEMKEKAKKKKMMNFK